MVGIKIELIVCGDSYFSSVQTAKELLKNETRYIEVG